jgi:putative restriction endonuclease
MQGTIAITDHGWYDTLRRQQLDEVNFWKPSAARGFRAPEFSPFLFKLRAPHNAICGVAFFARYSALPAWLAWQSFGVANGTSSFQELRERIAGIRDRIGFAGNAQAEIGCILLVQPIFFAPAEWVAAPADWPVRTQSYIHYDLAAGEGARVWNECLERMSRRLDRTPPGVSDVIEPFEQRHGQPQIVHPRLGQGTFRIAVMDAYDRACAVTGEHSLPALEAAHIRAFEEGGPHAVANGLFLRADVHRLFDQGYISVTPDLKIEVSDRLRSDYRNGRSYYPYRDQPLQLPRDARDLPSRTFLEWHRDCRYLG